MILSLSSIVELLDFPPSTSFNLLLKSSISVSSYLILVSYNLLVDSPLICVINWTGSEIFAFLMSEYNILSIYSIYNNIFYISSLHYLCRLAFCIILWIFCSRFLNLCWTRSLLCLNWCNRLSLYSASFLFLSISRLAFWAIEAK